LEEKDKENKETNRKPEKKDKENEETKMKLEEKDKKLEDKERENQTFREQLGFFSPVNFCFPFNLTIIIRISSRFSLARISTIIIGMPSPFYFLLSCLLVFPSIQPLVPHFHFSFLVCLTSFSNDQISHKNAQGGK